MATRARLTGSALSAFQRAAGIRAVAAQRAGVVAEDDELELVPPPAPSGVRLVAVDDAEGQSATPYDIDAREVARIERELTPAAAAVAHVVTVIPCGCGDFVRCRVWRFGPYVRSGRTWWPGDVDTFPRVAVDEACGVLEPIEDAELPAASAIECVRRTLRSRAGRAARA